jgi:putative transposase
MAKTPQPFSLPDEAIRSLKQTLSKGVHSTRLLTRARILLKLDEGLGPSQIAQEVGVHPNTVINVRKRANERGWENAIEDHPRGGRPPEVPGDARAAITALACSEPPTGHSQWSLRLLADKAVELGFTDEISHETVRRILKKTRSSRT